LNYNLKEISQNNFYYGFGIGNRLMIPTGSGVFEDMIDYHLTGGFDKVSSVGAEIQFAGFFDLAGDSVDISDRFFHILKFGIFYHSESAKSKFFCVIPLNEVYSELIKSLIGLEFQFYLK
jgi:hypothetical protein